MRSLDDLFDNAHLNEAGFFETVDSPDGPLRFPGPPTWFSRTPGRIFGPSPRLGAHTREVLEAAVVREQGPAELRTVRPRGRGAAGRCHLLDGTRVRYTPNAVG